MSARFVHGAKLYRGDKLKADLPTYAAVKGVKSVGLPVGFSVDVLESTDHDSPDYTKEFVPGLVDRGSVPFIINFDDNEASHVTLTTATEGRKKTAWKVELPLAEGSGNTTRAFYEFDGFVENIDQPEAGSEDVLESGGSIKVAGAVDFTPEAP